jgi:hypothetical protein
MIPKSAQRFSEKIMLKQEPGAGCRFKEKSSRSGARPSPGTFLDGCAAVNW